MNNGWIKLHRKFTKWGWYQKSEMVHLFLHFLLLANHEEKEWQGVKIKKGQFITGLKQLHKDTKISPQTLRTCISRLKSTGEITNKSTNKYRLITIVNWEEYQGNDKKLTSKSTSKLTINQQSTNNQLTPNNNNKNEKNIIEAKNLKKPFKDYTRVKCHDGSIVRRYFGAWVDDKDISIKIDPTYYPELK